MGVIDSFLLLGMGSIMRGLIELLKYEGHNFLSMPMVCICPEDIPEYIYKIKPDLKHIKVEISEKNVYTIIPLFVSPQVFVIDLTVNVNSVDIIKICKERGVFYINTSLEAYEGNNSSARGPEYYTLYMQELRLQNQTKDIKNPVTIVHSMGMNPGAISSLVYQGIEEYIKTYHPDKMKLLLDGKQSHIAEEFLDMIHISEFDNQEVKIKSKANKMINSWSGEGFIVEALSTSFVAAMCPVKDYKRSRYNKNILYSPKYKSMDCMTDSLCLYPDGTPFKYNGYMITHFEVISLSKYLSRGEYVPRISYVYSPSPISIKSLEYIRKRNYKKPDEYYVFNQKDVINKNSFDSLGATLFFRDGRKFWCGTVLTNKYLLDLMGPNVYLNATQLQVCAPILAGIEWIMKRINKDKGIITVEEIPYKYILKKCIPYWGHFYCKEIMQTDTEYNEHYKIP